MFFFVYARNQITATIQCKLLINFQMRMKISHNRLIFKLTFSEALAYDCYWCDNASEMVTYWREKINCDVLHSLIRSKSDETMKANCGDRYLWPFSMQYLDALSLHFPAIAYMLPIICKYYPIWTGSFFCSTREENEEREEKNTILR